MRPPLEMKAKMRHLRVTEKVNARQKDAEARWEAKHKQGEPRPGPVVNAIKGLRIVRNPRSGANERKSRGARA